MGGRNTWTKAGGELLGSPQPGTAISPVPPQAATEPERPRLTPHPWSLRGPQPPSKRLFLLVSTPPPGTLDLGLCGFLEVAGNWMFHPMAIPYTITFLIVPHYPHFLSPCEKC